MSNTNFEYFIDLKGKHRWRLVAGNGEIVDSSSQGFHDKAEAEANAVRVLNGLRHAYLMGEIDGVVEEPSE